MSQLSHLEINLDTHFKKPTLDPVYYHGINITEGTFKLGQDAEVKSIPMSENTFNFIKNLMLEKSKKYGILLHIYGKCWFSHTPIYECKILEISQDLDIHPKTTHRYLKELLAETHLNFKKKEKDVYIFSKGDTFKEGFIWESNYFISHVEQLYKKHTKVIRLKPKTVKNEEPKVAATATFENDVSSKVATVATESSRNGYFANSQPIEIIQEKAKNQSAVFSLSSNTYMSSKEIIDQKDFKEEENLSNPSPLSEHSYQSDTNATLAPKGLLKDYPQINKHSFSSPIEMNDEEIEKRMTVLRAQMALLVELEKQEKKLI